MKIFVVRHASAVERFLWDGDDSERPLDKMGADQSLLIAEFFSEIKISSIYSSLAVRCQQTIWPTARQSDVQVELSDALFEGSTKKTIELVETLTKAETTDGYPVLCSHGDVISELIRSLTLSGMLTPGGKGFAKASIWELIFSSGKIESGLYHETNLDNS